MLLPRSTISSMFLNLQHRQYGTKDLVLGDRHVVFHVVEQRRLDEVAAVAEALAAREALGPFFLPMSM